jgi:hypothetical protein
VAVLVESHADRGVAREVRYQRGVGASLQEQSGCRVQEFEPANGWWTSTARFFVSAQTPPPTLTERLVA